jgi:hypothetical protein
VAAACSCRASRCYSNVTCVVDFQRQGVHSSCETSSINPRLLLTERHRVTRTISQAKERSVVRLSCNPMVVHSVVYVTLVTKLMTSKRQRERETHCYRYDSSRKRIGPFSTMMIQHIDPFSIHDTYLLMCLDSFCAISEWPSSPQLVERVSLPVRIFQLFIVHRRKKESI